MQEGALIMMPYAKAWSGTQPGCLILLLDQSGSMDDEFGGTQVGGGRKKSDAVALVVNSFLDELISTNTIVKNATEVEVRPRADIAILGYGEKDRVESIFEGTLASEDFVSLPDLHTNPLAIEQREKKELDDTGKVVTVPVEFPIWVRPRANGGTPMHKALLQARDLAQTWATSHPDSYPPVIINITDGMAAGDLESVVNEITSITTSDGQALLFNVHITEQRYLPVEYPASISELPEDPFAQRLFAMSSIIPAPAHAALNSLLGRSVPPGARGMIFNGDASSVRLMFNFASAPALQHLIDPDK